jgi:two-component system phosphate regulon sensor histidine kinase PhoR
MPKGNCWEIMGCGRQVGGRLAPELGVCPAAACTTCAGANGGDHGGRLCWAVAGTLCGGEVQGSFAAKSASCTECEVFKRVQEEEGPAFQLLMPGQVDNHVLVEQFVSIMSIIDAINGIVYVADLDTHELLYVNPYATKLFGDHLVGKRCYEVLQTGQTGPCSFCTNDRLVVNGQPAPPVVWEFQNTVTHRWFMCMDKAIRWHDGRLVRMEVAIDITERKVAQQFRDEYVGLISHDLLNPLNAVMLTAQVARRSLLKKGLAAEAHSLDAVFAGARRMNTLIADLLETARLEAGHLVLRKRSLDLGDWAVQTVHRIAEPAARDRLVVRVEDGPVHVLADPGRLDRVLENLLSNALKYSGDAPVTVTVRRQAEEGVVSVSDQGMGLPAADLPRLFQRFYRASTHGRVKGTGLGLYNARLLVEAHGGRIWAESEVGRGSRFHFALPLEGAAAEGLEPLLMNATR